MKETISAKEAEKRINALADAFEEIVNKDNSLPLGTSLSGRRKEFLTVSRKILKERYKVLRIKR